ncbi:dihydrodipicolinate reductase [Thalassobius sp. S69A]|uniref:dihydrodipicolinate reductase n=1 Tax=unclassified Thalassovita TaxID=2619711 RepID=UPI003C7A9C2F
MRSAFLLMIFLALPRPLLAEGLVPITDRARFLSLIEGRELRRAGIRLTVLADGRITGRALGRPVSGGWQWQGQYFCRDMQWGDTPVGYNCQTVRLRGDVLRFTSDRGRGDFADLKLR